MYAVKIVVVVVFALMGVTHSRAETMLALWFAVWKQEQRSLESPGEPGTGSGKLAKRRSWPSDF